MHDVVKLILAGIAPLVASRINLEHITCLRREWQAQGKLERIAAMNLDRPA